MRRYHWCLNDRWCQNQLRPVCIDGRLGIVGLRVAVIPTLSHNPAIPVGEINLGALRWCGLRGSLPRAVISASLVVIIAVVVHFIRFSVLGFKLGLRILQSLV